MRKIDYPKLYGWSASHAALTATIRKIYVPAVVLVVLAYAFHLGLCIYYGPIERVITLLAVSGAPFAAVSVLRYFINAPRPYEVYDFGSLGLAVPRHKLGRSFPSRHTFSAFLIGTLLLADFAAVGAFVLVLGVYLAASRVILGIHFIRDVAAGALVGVLCGALGAVCIYLFC